VSISPGSELTVFENGRMVGHRPLNVAVARDRPDKSFRAGVKDCDSQNGAADYELSPDGATGLCSNFSDGRHLYLFDPVHPTRRRAVVPHFEGDAGFAVAWIDNAKFAAIVYDNTPCPKAHLYDYFPTHVEVFDRSGKRIAKGPCAFGVIEGNHREALLGTSPNGFIWKLRQIIADDPNYYNEGYGEYHDTWSVDGGQTWHDGKPLTFDGNGVLLYHEEFTESIWTENGRVAFKNALYAKWSR